MSTLENRIEEMQKKASAKSAELQTMATAPEISDKKKERLENRAEKVEERADKREGVMRSNAEWWEWIKGGMNSAPATTPQSNTTNQPQTTPPQTTTTTPPQTKAEGGTTPQTITTTTSEEVDFDINKDGVVDNTETLIGITKQGNQQRMDALKVFQEAQAKGLSAYQTLLKDSLKRKEEVAKKQERNARSQAIANALGSLVNVITAGAIAKRNGNIPIVAEYDDTADSALRKSIEQRYALGNENENLLMNLENERRKHEADIAKQNYDQTIASIDAETKAKIAPIAQQIALEEYEQKAKIRANAQKDVREHSGEVQKGVHDHKVDNPLPSQKDKNKAPKKRVFTGIENKFLAAINKGKTKNTTTSDGFGGKKTTKSERPLSDEEKDTFANIALHLDKQGIKGDDLEKAISVYNTVWVRMPAMESRILGENFLKYVINAIKATKEDGSKYTADEIVANIK